MECTEGQLWEVKIWSLRKRCGWSWRTFEDISILAIFLFCFSPPLHKFWPSWAILDGESDLFSYVVEFGGLWLFGGERERRQKDRGCCRKRQVR